MSQLRLSFLGQFQVILDGQVVRRFESDNARALLAYLALEAGQAHRRSRKRTTQETSSPNPSHQAQPGSKHDRSGGIGFL